MSGSFIGSNGSIYGTVRTPLQLFRSIDYQTIIHFIKETNFLSSVMFII